MVRLLGVDLPSTETTHPDLCSLHALPGFGQPFGQRGGPGRHGSASVGQSACLNTSPQFTTPPILTATLGNTGEIRQSSISPPVLFLPSGRALQVAPERPSTCLISPGHVAGHVGRKKGGLHNPDLAWPPRKLYGHGQRFRASLRPLAEKNTQKKESLTGHRGLVRLVMNIGHPDTP